MLIFSKGLYLFQISIEKLNILITNITVYIIQLKYFSNFIKKYIKIIIIFKSIQLFNINTNFICKNKLFADYKVKNNNFLINKIVILLR